ncbi:MAG: hypothetical protein M3R38_20890 [Actinomycetota bacterium]|nr:hypothetical protein [Actinomycetota bacterium]
MQPKPLPPPSGQPALPLEIPPRSSPPPEAEEVVGDHCAPEEAWNTLEPAGRDRLRKAWLRVLKEVVGDARDR